MFGGEGVGVAVAGGFGERPGVLLDAAFGKVDDQIKRQGGPGVNAEFGGAVALQGRIGHFDDGQDIRGARFAGIVARGSDDEGAIRLRFTERGKGNRLLGLYVAAEPRHLGVERRQKFHDKNMLIADGHRVFSLGGAVLVNKAAVEQFDGGVFLQDLLFDHAMVLGDGEADRGRVAGRAGTGRARGSERHRHIMA